MSGSTQPSRRVKSEDIDRILERNMAANLERIRKIAPGVGREWKKAGMVVGIDTHDQMRYDKKPKGIDKAIMFRSAC